MAAISLARGEDVIPTYIPRHVPEAELLPRLKEKFDPLLQFTINEVVAIFPPDGMEGKLTGDWIATSLRHPDAYLMHRWNLFARQIGLGDTKVYFPFHTGMIDPNEFVPGFRNISPATGSAMCKHSKCWRCCPFIAPGSTCSLRSGLLLSAHFGCAAA